MKLTTIPQIKPHYQIEVVEPKQVYLLSEQSTHVLSGQLYCQILPLLTGEHTLEQIVQKLEGQVLPEHIDYVLDRLEQKGYLTEGLTNLSPQTAGFWSALGIAPSQAVRCMQSARVVLKALGQVDTEPLAAALAAVGIQTQSNNDRSLESPTLTVVLTDDYLRQELAEINQQACQTGQPWLLVKPVGRVLWLGSIFEAGTGCWDCLAHRLRGNRELETMILRQKQSQVSGCLPMTPVMLPSTLQMGLQLATTEVAKWLIKQELEENAFSTLEGKIVTFDYLSLELKTHALPYRPQCPTCGNPKLLHQRGFEPVRLHSRLKQFTSDGGHRAVSPSQTVEKHRHLISPISGVVTELVRISDPSNPLVHTYRASHSFGNATSLKGLRHALRYKSSGKGKSDRQSQASGFCEAVERYSGIYQGDEPRIRATLEELDGAIHPEQCLLFSDRQYANRETLNQQETVAHDWIPQRFDPTQAIDWTPVWSLTERVHKYLPTSFCYYAYPLPKDRRFCKADSNGNAAGNTLEEAILQGFLELVERDSVGLWWYNRIQRPQVDLASFDEPYFLQLQEFYRQNNRELWVLDVTADLGIPAFTALSRRTDGNTERIIAGFGCHLDPKIAILRALTEVNQLGLELDKIPAEELGAEFKQWMLSVTIENQPYLAPETTVPVKTASDYPQGWSNDIYTDVMTCIEIARQAGLETLVLDQTRPDIGLNVVKVIVPGMRHFWSRFGAGRLYDIPVKLGWRDTPLPEDWMNSIPMPF